MGVILSAQCILGIDPGSQNMGFGVISSDGTAETHIHHGVITIPNKLSLPGKLFYAHEKLGELFLQFKPTCFALEDIFLGKNPKSAFILGHVRGVCLQIAYKNRCDIQNYAARTVKKTITGSGAASKEQVRNVVTRLLNISTEAKLDATDALAIAITYSRHQHVQTLQKKGVYL